MHMDMALDTTFDTALRRVTAIAALVFVLGSSASADDFLLLRDGTQKRGVLSSCDQSNCRLGAETVARSRIEWIGLDRGAQPPPAVRDQERDELHLVNQSVQTATLSGVDAGFVHAAIGGQGFSAASSLPRRSVAWIHLGRPRQAANEPAPDEPAGGGRREPTGTEHTDPTSDEQASRDAAAAAAAPWRLPTRIYIALPPHCPTCEATLHVLDLKREGDDVVLVKNRTISISDSYLSGSWISYEPPVPIFPATTRIARFAFEGTLKTNVTHDIYGQKRPGRGGGAAPPAPSADPADTPPENRSTVVTKRMFGKELYDEPAAALGRALANRWREYIADERAAQNAAAGGAGSAGGGGAKQHRRITGEASYTLTLRITNWTIIANDLVRRRASGWEPYAQLQQVPVYDVYSDLRFMWRDRNVRARDVDKDGYTADWAQHDASGPRRPVPDDTIGIPQASSRPWPEPDSGPGVVDWLFGERAPQQVRERVQQAREAADSMRDQVQDARQGAEDWLRDRLARDREALGLGGSGGPQSSAGPGAGPAHAVLLGMRWYRRDGRITPNHLDEIIMDVVEGRPSRLNYTVSATLPNGAFDIREPPNWTPPNPKPPPPPARPGGSWLRP